MKVTISMLDKALSEIVENYAVYGAECIINALVRGCIKASSRYNYLTKDYVITMVSSAYEREEKIID